MSSVRDVRRDARSFFISVLALAGGFMAGAPVKLLVRLSRDYPDGPSLVSRISPERDLEQTLGIFHVSFVMLPAFIAFLAIGIPVLVMFVIGSVRSRWPRRETLLMVAVLVSLAGVMAVRHSPVAFLSAVGAVVLTAVIGAWPTLRRYGSVVGFRVLAAGGLMLAGLVYYEYMLLTEGTVSTAVAPTLLVFSVLALVVGLPLVTIGQLSLGLGAQVVVLALWVCTGLWAAVPFSRGIADGSISADWLELRSTAFLAVVLVAAELVEQRRRSRSRAAVAAEA